MASEDSNAKVNCSSTEGTLELDVRQRKLFPWSTNDNPYTVTFSFLLNGDRFEYIDEQGPMNKKFCLPMDECHSLIINRQRNIWQKYDVLLKIDDEVLKNITSQYMYESISFGDCDAKCSPNEAEFELFAYQYNNTGKLGDDDVMSWNLTPVQSKNETLLEGKYYDASSKLSFVYENICVPNDTCLKLNIGVGPKSVRTEGTVLFGSERGYSVSHNGVLYRRVDTRYDPRSRKSFYLGPCTVENVCNEEVENLVEAQIYVNETIDQTGEQEDDILKDLNFAVVVEDLEAYGFLDHFSQSDGTLVGQNIGVKQCIPKNDCTVLFAMDTNAPVTSYDVTRNGVAMLERTSHGGGYLVDWITTTFFECPSSS